MLPDYGFPYAVDSGNAASHMRDQAIKAQTGLWGQFITGLTWSRPQGADEQTYNKALGLLWVNAQQQGQAAVGTPALSFMTGPAGSAMRALDAMASGYQIGQGVGKVQSGDTLSGATDISAGILNATLNAAAQWGITKATRAAQATEVVANREAQFSRIVEGGGLQAHENAGGHLSQTLDANQAKITDWLSGSSNRLRLDYSLSDPVGISVSRGATEAVDVSSSRAILIRDLSMPTGYKILTGFPTKP